MNPSSVFSGSCLTGKSPAVVSLCDSFSSSFLSQASRTQTRSVIDHQAGITTPYFAREDAVRSVGDYLLQGYTVYTCVYPGVWTLRKRLRYDGMISAGQSIMFTQSEDSPTLRTVLQFDTAIETGR